jgi:O-antigen/teichoic acid export membrane protein
MTLQRAAHAGFWSAVDVVMRQLVQFVVSVILARLLAPSDFGLVALVAFFSSLATVFIQGGLTTALIQRSDSGPEMESGAFWLNLGASAIFALLLLLIAPSVASVYKEPLLRPLMGFAAAQVVLSALGAVHSALLSRALNFVDLAKAGVGSALLSGAVGLIAAWRGAGVWALAYQGLVAMGSYSLFLWMLSGWRPLLRFRLGEVRPLIRFGWWLSVSAVLEVLYTQGFSLLVGKLHGVRDLGLYNRASNTQMLPSTSLSIILARVILPLFAPRAEDVEGTRRGFRTANSLVMLLNVPAMVGLIVVPDLVTVALFGPQWRPAAPILAILALSGLLYPLHLINLNLLLARGQSRTFFQLELAKKLIGIAIVVVGSIFGIVGLAWSQVAMSVFALFLNAAPSRRALGYGPIAQLWDLRGIGLSAAVMAAGILLARPFLHLPPLQSLLILVPGGAFLYFGCGFALRLHSFREGLNVVRLLLDRRGRGDLSPGP